jgi:hypothetical protein
LPKPASPHAPSSAFDDGRSAEVLGEISEERDKVIDRTSVAGPSVASIGARVFFERSMVL